MTVRVALVMRRALPGQRSVERLFSAVVPALPGDIELDRVELPHASLGVWRRIANVVHVARLRADVVHVSGDVYYCALLVRRRRLVVTVLDLVSVHRLRGWRRWALTTFWYRLPLRRAAAITAISEATMDELREVVPEVVGRCEVIGCAVDSAFADAGRERPLAEVPSSPVVLIVGTSRVKNVERTLTATVGLDVHVRVIGPLTVEQSSLLEAAGSSSSSAHGLGDDELVDEYARATVLVFASSYEGFGLPIVEANAIGLPVVTSDREPMRSVAGDAAVLVDPDDVRSIRHGIERVIRDDRLRSELRERGVVNARRFSTQTIAASYAAAYRRVAAGD